jgi:hypothetical protein
MSWHDLIDDQSVDRFVSGGSWVHDISGGDDDEEDVTAPPPPVEDVVSTMSNSNEQPADARLYETDLLNASLLSEASLAGGSSNGVTIVSSGPTSASATPAGGIVPIHPTPAILGGASILESNGTTSLSFNPSSVDSSELSQFSSSDSSISEAGTEEIVFEQVTAKDLGSKNHDTSSLESLDRHPSSASFSTLSSANTHDVGQDVDVDTEDQLRLWYNSLERPHQNWKEFRTYALGLLDAVQDSTEDDKDAQLARLLAQEEEASYRCAQQSHVEKKTEAGWLIDAAAIAGAVAIGTIAVIKILRSIR